MLHYGTLHDYKFADQGHDVRGTLLYGAGDEKLGKIHDVIFDHETGVIKYAIIDTGGWLHHHFFLVPAERIRPYEKHEDHFYASLTREQIEALPPYDPKLVHDHDTWSDYEERYRQAWKDDEGILHAEGSPRIITPEHDQVVGQNPTPGGPGTSAGGNVVESSIPGYTPEIWPERIESPTKLPHGPGVNLHPQEQTPTSAAVSPWSSQNRWEAFQGSLRRHLPDILKDCKTCGPDQEQMQDRSGLEQPPRRKAG